MGKDRKKDRFVVVPGAFIKINIREASHDVVVKTRDGREKVVYRAGR